MSVSATHVPHSPLPDFPLGSPTCQCDLRPKPGGVMYLEDVTLFTGCIT